MPSLDGATTTWWPVYHRVHDGGRAHVTRDRRKRTTDELRAVAAEPAAPERRPWSTIFNLVVFGVAGVALVWMLRATSWAELRVVLGELTSWAALIVALDLLSMCLDAAAWHALMRPEARMVPYWRVLGAWASGRAINVLTPLGALGEATKVTLLLDHAPRTRVLSSIVLLNVMFFYVGVSVILIGIPITLLLVDLPHPLKVLVGIGIAVIVPAVVALGLVIHRGAMATLVGLLRHARLISADRAARWKDKLRDVDRHIRELHHHQTAGTRTALVVVVVSRLVSHTATLLLIHAVGVPLSGALIVGAVSVGVLIAWTSSVVPLGLGLAEGGNYALYSLLGASGAYGVVVTLLTRARSVTIALLGLVAMALLTVQSRLFQARIRRALKARKDQQG